MSILTKDFLTQVDQLPFECDGLSILLSDRLEKAGESHRLVRGTLYRLDGGGPKEWTLRTMPPMTVPARDCIRHVWIALPDGCVVDLRARMWFGDDAPHGLFDPKSFSNFVYEEDA